MRGGLGAAPAAEGRKALFAEFGAGAVLAQASVSAIGSLGIAAIGVGLLALALLLFVLLLLSRRQQRRDLRKIVAELEELRSGRPGRKIELDSRSPFTLLAESVNRLGQELAARPTEAEGTGEGLRAILDGARDYGIVTTDTDGDIRGFNAGASALFGWEEEEVVSRPASILFEEASWHDLLPKLARRSLRERGVESRSMLKRRNGELFQGQLAIRLLHGRAGDPTGFLLLIKDVSAEVRQEAQLRATLERHTGFLEGLDQGILLLQGGRILHANAAAAKLLGRDAEALAGTLLRDRVGTRDVMSLQAMLDRLEKGSAGQREELRLDLLAPDGRTVMDVSISAASTVHEAKPAVWAAIRDESEERRIEAELRQTETRLDSLLESVADGMVVLIGSLRSAVVGMTNRAFLEIFDLGDARVLGVSEGELLRLLREQGEGAEEVAALMAAADSGTKRETISLGAGGSKIVELTAAPLTDRSGARLGKMLVCHDTSRQAAHDRRIQAEIETLAKTKARLEEAYRALTGRSAALTRRAAELERLNQELRTLDQMKSNLLANVSHELQTPLVSIRGYTEMILKERLGTINEEQRKGLSHSLRNIDRLIAMIDNLMAFVRMDREASDLKIGSFPLRAAVDEGLQVLRSKIESRHIKVSTSFDDPDVLVRADKEKILQVFLNLLSNAVKYNREAGSIGIQVRSAKPGFATVRITDTGIGIPEEDLEKVFDRFYRAEQRGSESAQGSGLGLAIVRSILRLHGCSIHAESRVGEGSAFIFTLPVAAAEKQDGGEPTPLRAPEAGPRAPEPAEPPPEPKAPPSDRPAPRPRPSFRIIRRK